MTVLGPVEAPNLGVTLPHEHLLWESHYIARPSAEIARLRTLGDVPVSLALVETLLANPFASADNLRQRDVALAAAEAGRLSAVGGSTIIDVTTPDIGRDARGLHQVAELTGLNIIAATGYYLASAHPPGLADRRAEDIAQDLIAELTDGIDGTGIRAGIIGEIGVGQPMYGRDPDGPPERAEIAPGEELVLRAAALAQRATGTPITLHIWNFGPNRLGVRALDILAAAGADPALVVVGHLDAYLDMDHVRAVLARGAWVEFDAFGVAPYPDWETSRFVTDDARVDAVRQLAEMGALDRLLISQDVCTKTQLSTFGGPGYAHLSTAIEPQLAAAGLSAADVGQVRIGNPARLMGG
jgi:phosphotriesterase-related protein